MLGYSSSCVLVGLSKSMLLRPNKRNYKVHKEGQDRRQGWLQWTGTRKEQDQDIGDQAVGGRHLWDGTFTWTSIFSYTHIYIQCKCSPKDPLHWRWTDGLFLQYQSPSSANTQYWGENLVIKMAAMGLRMEGRERFNNMYFLSPRPSCHLLSL